MADASKLIPDEPRTLQQMHVPLLQIEETNGTNVRRGLFDSIARHGVLQPVLLVRDPRRKLLKISEGRRRVAASRELELKSIPAVITQASDAVSAAMTLETNEHRSANPAGELAAIERLMKKGYDERAICDATGMAIATIRKRLKLASLSPDLRKCWERGEIVTRAAETASKLDAARQRALVKIAEEAGRVTAHDVREMRNADAAVALDGLADQLVELKRDWREDLRQLMQSSLGVCEDAANAHPRQRKSIDAYRTKIASMLVGLR